MPTAKPRVNIVVSESQHRLLMELGELQGRSASSIVRELLDMAEPVFRATLPPLRAAKVASDKQPEEARRIVLEALTPKEPDEDGQLSLTDFLLHLVGRGSADGAEADRSAPAARGPNRTARTDAPPE